jgi:carbamoyltransferase
LADEYKQPILLNTSFNLAGEPIVESPTDAIRTFAASGLMYLYLQGYLLEKN